MFLHVSGSPLRLLGLLLACGHYIWSPMHILYARLPHGWCRVALPLLALLPLATERSVCHRLVPTPGVGPPLAALHALLYVLHTACLAPATQVLAAPASPADPLQQCLVVELYLLQVVGIVLPLAAISALERSDRHRFALRQQRLSVAGGGAAPSQQQQEQQEPGTSWLQLYFTSSCAWALACAIHFLPFAQLPFRSP